MAEVSTNEQTNHNRAQSGCKEDCPWLDSLSEDWISQPGSFESPRPLNTPSPSPTIKPQPWTKCSRIPRFKPKELLNTHDGPKNTESKEFTSKICTFITTPTLNPASKAQCPLMKKSNAHTRTLSASTNSADSSSSVKRHEIIHELRRCSSTGLHSAPEWRKSIEINDFSIDKRDLFSGPSLESIYKSPFLDSNSRTHPSLEDHKNIGINSQSNSQKYFGQQKTKSGSAHNDNESCSKEPGQQKFRALDLHSDIKKSHKSTIHASNSNPNIPEHVSNYFSPEKTSAPIFIETNEKEVDCGTERTSSGQSISMNEQLSQIILEKQSSEDGQFHFAPANLPSSQFLQKLERIREEKLGDSPKKQGHNFNGINYRASEIIKKNSTEKPLKYYLSQEDLRKSTLLKSPLSLSDQSALLPEESLQASTPKEIPNSSNTCENSKSDYIQSQPKISERQIKSLNRKAKKESENNPRSPLKIFGTYDTFTNEKLLSRVSQFEYELKDRDGSLAPIYSGNRSMSCEFNKRITGMEKTEKTNVSGNSQIQIEKKTSSTDLRDPNNIKFSRKDHYDQYENEFCQKNKENLRSSHDSNSKSALNINPYTPVSSNNLVMCSQDSNPVQDTPLNETSNNIRIKPKLHIAPPQSNINSSLHIKDHQRTPRSKNSYVEGKRLPKTPLRHPDAKRRRTLQTVEFDEKPTLRNGSKFESLKEAHHKIYSVTNKDQINLIPDKSWQMINPEIHSIPSILNNNKLNNSHRNSSDIPNTSPSIGAENTVDKNADPFSSQLYSKGHQKVQQINCSFSQAQTNNSKSSFTSEDFIETAKKIMSGLREKGRSDTVSTKAKYSNPNYSPNCSLNRNLFELRSDDSHQESTQEPFSRPPSRDGAVPLPNIPYQQDNPELLEHLRKYYEDNDFEAVIASSLRSISNAKKNCEIAKQIDLITEEKVMKASLRRFASPTYIIERCPPACKVSEINGDKKSNDPTSAVPCLTTTENGNDFLSFRSNASSVPKSVSHLIPEQLAGMVFDRELNKWVKEKTRGETINTNILVSEDTEDDPFEDIPDLSVDEALERKRINAISDKNADRSSLPYTHNEHEARCILKSNIIPKIKSILEDPNNEILSSPVPVSSNLSDGSSHKIRLMKISGSSSRKDNKAFSTKAMKSQGSFPQPKKSPSLPKIREEFLEVNKENVSHQDFSFQNRSSKQRNITISFSSPIASFIETQGYNDHPGFYRDNGHARDLGDLSDIDNMSNKLSCNEDSCSQTLTTAKHVPSRKICQKLSLGGQHHHSQSVSRIDERDEDIISYDDENENSKNLSIVLTTTLTPVKISNAHNTPIPIREIGTLTLTPLPDFTANLADESFGLDISYLPPNQQTGVDNAKKTLSLSIKELVRKITEVEPFEPYWEHLKEINLKDKCLKSVHKLDEFCERLMDLDISCNQINTLDGVPRTVQTLNISNNILSDMTAWSHLINLQYVDVSNNNLESLSSLRCLVHLRSLRADKNKVSSLEGIDQLEGLLSLRLRENSVHILDFHDSKFQLLTDLDLRSNQISKAANIQRLRSLTKLDLVDNNLSEFGADNSESLESIKYLKLSGNNLKSIDVSAFPNLRVLYLDRNRLGRLTGLMKAKYLDSLSLREQRDSVVDQNIFSEAFEVRKLFLSGNLLNKLELVSHFLNLQYIELANCGLESLPYKFGTMLANVRVLNLNFNALTDISPLKGILRLKRLHLSGNRLLGLDNLTKVLSELPTLSSLDLRCNPITMGFYSPILERDVTLHATINSDESKCQEPYKMAKMNKSKDTLYTSCLDMRTRMKRRIYEMFLIRSMPRLKSLDGLTVDRSVLFENDEVYRSMVEAGFITPSHADENSSNYKERVDRREESRENLNDEPWYAEDSFG